MPILTPPSSVTAIQKRFGLEGLIKWRVETNNSIHQSEELDDRIIVMKPGDRLENYVHETGHIIYDSCNKPAVIPILQRIRDKYRVHYKDYDKEYWSRLKMIELGGEWYSYSHSGKAYEYDELFAVSFAFQMTPPTAKFDDSDIQKDYEAMLKTCETVFNPNPYDRQVVKEEFQLWFHTQSDYVKR